RGGARGRAPRLPLAGLAAADRGRHRRRRRGRADVDRGRRRARPRRARRCGAVARRRLRRGGTMTDEIDRKVAESLDAMGVGYEVMSIDPDFADTARFCERYGIPPEKSGNTIIVASKKEPKQYCACVVLATTRLDVNHAVKKLMGASRVSFASSEETMALT